MVVLLLIFMYECVNTGDKVTAKVTEVKSVLGSWIISYEKIAVKED